MRRDYLEAFAVLAAILLLAGCAQPPGGQEKAAQPSLQGQGPQPAVQNATNASQESDELSKTQKEMDSLDSSVQESMADLEQLK